MREIDFEELMEQIPLFKQIHLWNVEWEPIDNWLNELEMPEEEHKKRAVLEHIKNIAGTKFNWVFLQIDSREAHELLIQFKKVILHTDEPLELEGKRIPGEVLSAECYPERYYIPANAYKYTGEAWRFSVLEAEYKKGLHMFYGSLPHGDGLLRDFMAWNDEGERIEFSGLKELKKIYRASYIQITSTQALRFLQMAGFDNYMNSPFKIPSPHMPRRYYLRNNGNQPKYMWGDWTEEIELEYFRAREAFF